MAPSIAQDRAHKQNLARRLLLLRLRQRLTQKELAHACNTGIDSIRRYESGASAPSFWRVRDLARGLGVPLEALFCEPDEACLGAVVVSAQTLKRIRLEGEPAIVEIAGVLASQMESALRHARPLLDPPQGPAFARRRVRKKAPQSQRERLEGLQARSRALKAQRAAENTIE